MPHRTWLVFKKGLSGSGGGYRQYWIYRYLCKNIGGTVSMHPQFSHAGKRYILAFVIECLSKLIERGKSLYAVAKCFEVPRQTLRRWCFGLLKRNEIAKWASFFHGGLPEGCTGFAPALLQHFRTIGNGTLERGTSLAMVCLHEGFSRPLY